MNAVRLNNIMAENLLPPAKLYRGPDAIRGTGYAFLVTRYPDKDGKRFFVEPGQVGHEHIISNENVVRAMLGPEFDKLKDQLTYQHTVWANGLDGQLIDTGERRLQWDYWEVRKHTMNTNLYGRYGQLQGYPVLMLWQRPENWEEMADIAIKELNVPDEAILTAGTEELGLVGDYRSQKKKLVNRDQDPGERERLSALARYHVATGAEKEALKKQFGFGKGGGEAPYPDTTGWTDEQKAKYPWKRSHWRTAAQKAGVKGVFDYGEMRRPASLGLWGFKEFVYDAGRRNPRQVLESRTTRF